MEVTQILIISHSFLCQSIIDTAKMIGLSDVDILAIPLTEEMSMETYEELLRENFKNLKTDSLVLVDLIGGTPFNVLCKLINEYEIYGVSGFNLAMLLEAWSARNYSSGKELQETVMNTGREAISNLNDYVASLLEVNNDDDLDGDDF